MKRIAKSKLPKNKEASNLATENNQKSERRFIGRDMSCEVCGDKARSHNYGGISCNCCRSFFSHFVLNNVRNYPSTSNVKKCKFQENCTINQVTRRKCRTCRFFKCVSIGMDPSWVLSDYEKPQKLRKEKNSESNQSKVQQQILPQDNTLSEEEAEKIANIAKYYKTACQLIPYNFVSREKSEILSPTKLQILNIGIISTVIRRCVCFARMIPEFQRLSLHDQTNLLRRSVMEMAILRDSVIYDFTAHAYTCNSDVDQYPEVTVEECDMLWPGEISDMYVQLCTRIQTLCPDEASIMLLTPLVLFSDSGGNDSCTEFEDRSAINSAQEYYSRLLEKYLKKVYGDEKGKQIFPRLLSKLPDVTQASQLHQGIPLNMTEDQVNKMHLHLLRLQRGTNTQTCQSSSTNYFGDDPAPREYLNSEKDCCKKVIAAARQSSASSILKPESHKTENSSPFPSLINTFVSHPGEWGIKPEYFEAGPHCGIERAYMRRIPELLSNPWDSLVNDVEKLAISNKHKKRGEI
ncbi:nuclear receptor subfamily 1 group D member 2 isoform X1 [Folsomia candida]|uniref:nuclear receptor subfamily 1 group D member 2 isoform X1 n=1 Tax=Folsomia candida TaxID=158441 RepID=UPI000B8F8065|nr:nuclear receptor subfamily 1 group D member 2 isoform X1 [Folsomia candida]XP_035714033.1 nuclear receptor subfamily 1 group D member 2 isoform X1 [Folsomia candida]XP_035714034.1 nuclear receptor subfamily 1 group D member 2 isoform X1 [Folsomia candida]